MQRIYFDYASATPLDPRALLAMQPFFSETFGNPSAIHSEGTAARAALEDARAVLATAFHARPEEVVFTSNGTESNNLAVLGIVRKCEESNVPVSRMHFITSAIEHPSVRDVFAMLEERGASVSYISVTRDGVIDVAALEKALRPETVLVSVMLVNSEIGTIQPIAAIAQAIKTFRRRISKSVDDIQSKTPDIPLLHTDASQAALFMELDVAILGVDMMTIDAQKIYGPKGAGALYVRRGTPITPLLLGGKQEHGLRAGTQNVPAIVGFAEALRIAEAEREGEAVRLTALREYCVEELLRRIPNVTVNGSRTARIPNNINISIQGISSELMLLRLDSLGIACAARSACLGGGAEGSYVVAAIDGSRADSALRFTLGRDSTKEKIDRLVTVLASEVVTTRGSFA